MKRHPVLGQWSVFVLVLASEVMGGCGSKKDPSGSTEQGAGGVAAKLAPADVAALKEYAAKTYPGTKYTKPSKVGPEERSCSLSVTDVGLVTGTGTAVTNAGHKTYNEAVEWKLVFVRDGADWKCDASEKTASWFKWTVDGEVRADTRGPGGCYFLRYCFGHGVPDELRMTFENEMKKRVGTTGTMDAKEGVYIACDKIEDFDVDVTEDPKTYTASLVAWTMYWDKAKPGETDESKLELRFTGDGKTWTCDKGSRAYGTRVGNDGLKNLDACAAFQERCVARPAPSPVAAPIDAGVAPETPAADAGAQAGDALESAKQVGSLTVTLKKVGFSGKRVTVEFLVKNDSDASETISGLAQFDAVNSEGDQGKLATESWDKCSGGVPPRGVRKCKLVYDFAKPQTSVQVEVKSTGMAPSIYFKLAK
jgi:hypothetical protein